LQKRGRSFGASDSASLAVVVLVVVELTTVMVLPMLVWELVEGVRVWEVSDDEGAIGIFSKMSQLVFAYPLYKGAHRSLALDTGQTPERSGLLLSNFYIRKIAIGPRSLFANTQ